MNILITGIHGFVGTNLVQHLGHVHTIYGLDIISPEKKNVVKTFLWEELDTCQELPTIDVIIHLAGKAHDTKNETDTKVYFDVNYGLTCRIFDFFIKSSARKFVFFSSVKAAADSVKGDILTENVIPHPIGPYGESKIAAENHILPHLLKHEGKEIYILRPCMIHGPGNKGNLNLLYNVVSKGIPWPLGMYENRRSFTSIDNLCFIIDSLLTHKIENGIYHIGDDEPLSTNDLIRIICEELNLPNRTWKVNQKFIEICASIGTVLHLPLNKERLRKLTENYVVSNMKIKEALGVTELPIKAKDGLRKTISSFKKSEGL